MRDTVAMKVCGCCKVSKPHTSEFFNRNASTPTGLAYSCKPCQQEASNRWRDKNRAAYNKGQARRNLAKHHRTRPDLMRKFGITRAEFDEMVRAQEGRCAICTVPTKRLVVDHDHESGQIRGLLCGSCNLGIGNLKDDTDNLRSAIRYLEGNT
jgi:hypothetical protein